MVYGEACLLAFIETWLDDHVHNHELIVDGFGAPIHLDRNKVDMGKEQGGGVRFYVNKKWCNTVFVREALCTPDIELLSISLHPFYLPREFPQLFFTLVFSHPHANALRAIEHITDNIHKLDSISPDAPKFILGDFNNCSLNKTLKTYHQYVTCPTCFNKTIDLCFGVPMSLALPPLGSADHKCASGPCVQACHSARAARDENRE